jgi:rare lipoprotein A
MIQKLSLLLIICILAGCQTMPIQPQISQKSVKKKLVPFSKKPQHLRYKQQQDGAPKSIPIVFKEPKPVKESLSRYGNPATYIANGQSYSVMRSSVGYKARGVASWYGTKFHKQRTSSGDLYDMYAMTAAHKTLPLPSYVKVKNLKNGREAVVKVNDRGPFHADRVIDLSYAAAIKLGLLPKGTANVEIEVLKGADTKSHYYLQAGAFAAEHSAKILQDKLAHMTPSPVFIEHYNGHFIVRVGPFAQKKMTDTLKMHLAAKGVYGTFTVLS